MNCSSRSGVNYRSFHWQCAGCCWSSTQCWQRSTNLYALWLCRDSATKEDVLRPFSSIWGFDFLVDLPKPYNFAFRIYCRSFVSVPQAGPGDWEKVWLSGVGAGALQWRVQFLTHFSVLTLFYRVHRSSCVCDILEQEGNWRDAIVWTPVLKKAAFAYVGQVDISFY